MAEAEERQERGEDGELLAPTVITCIDCGGRAHLLTTWPEDDPPQPGDVVQGDALAWLDRAAAAGDGAYDVAFCDPPYAFAGWDGLLGALGRLGVTVVVAESAADVAVPAGWEIVRVRRYGGTVVTLTRPLPPARSAAMAPAKGAL